MWFGAKAIRHHSSRLANLVESESDARRNPDPEHQQLHVLLPGRLVGGAPSGTRSCLEDGRTGRCQRASGTAAPRLIGATPILADAMYAPVVRFLACDLALDEASAAYCRTIKLMPPMQDRIGVANEDPQDIVELEREFRAAQVPPRSHHAGACAPRWCIRERSGAVTRLALDQA
ncbi:MAG: hypothetical protein JNK92_00570 [Dechloromonas sp.]|nr:hypothetical protein [Dechloromonas sp.]